MIELKINGEIHSIPSNWKDISWAKYCDIVQAVEKPLIERVAVYTGLDIELLQRFTLSTFLNVCDMVAFCDDYTLVDSLAKPYQGELNVGAETYEKLENCKMAASKAANPITAGAKIIKEYTGEDINDRCVLDVYAQVMFFFAQINKFLDKYKRLNDYEPSEDEIEAGIDQVTRFGTWGTAVAYARRTNMKIEEVWKRPATEIYTTLLLDFEQAELNKRLRAVKERNDKISQKMRGR